MMALWEYQATLTHYQEDIMSNTIELTKVSRKYLAQLSMFLPMLQDTQSFIKLDDQTQLMITDSVNSFFSIMAGVNDGTIELI
jgi:hypothetical protein